MRKSHAPKKLQLSRETVRHLTDFDLRAIYGGREDSILICPTNRTCPIDLPTDHSECVSCDCAPPDTIGGSGNTVCHCR